MSSYSLQYNLPTYSVDKLLVESLENYFKNEVPRILGLSTEASMYKSSFVIIIEDIVGHEKLNSISEFQQRYFRNDIREINIKFTASAENGTEIKINLRLGKKIENTKVFASLTDEKAREKVSAIEEGIYTVLNQHKNLNWILYPIDWINGILLIGFFIAGAVAVGDKKTNQERFIFGTIFCLGVIYYVILRVFKGYCTFDTNKQKRLDTWFNWFIFGLLGFLFFSTLLTSIRKSLFGF